MPVEQWLKSNTTISFPFIGSADGLEGFVVDARVSLPSTMAPLNNARIKINRWEILTISPFVLKLILARADTGAIILDTISAHTLTSQVLGAWTVATILQNGVIARFMLNNETMTTNVYLSASIYLADKAVDQLSAHVSALHSLPLIDPAQIQGPAKGLVELEAGYNIELTPEESGIGTLIAFDSTERPRGRSRLRMNVTPGAGAGVFPLCEAVPAIISINGVSPNEFGDFNLDLDACTWLERPGVNSGPNVVLDTTLVGGPPNIARFHQDCSVCCECDEYYDLYESIRAQWTRLTEAYGSLVRTRDIYEDIRLDWLAAHSTTCNNMIVTPRLTAAVGWRVAATILVQNGKGCDIENLSVGPLVIAVTSPSSAGIIVPNTAVVFTGGRELELTWSPVGAPYQLAILRTGRFVALTFEIQVNLPHSAGQTVTVTGSVTAAGVPAVPINVSTQLVGPLNWS